MTSAIGPWTSTSAPGCYSDYVTAPPTRSRCRPRANSDRATPARSEF
jgi:hypothetical protein